MAPAATAAPLSMPRRDVTVFLSDMCLSPVWVEGFASCGPWLNPFERVFTDHDSFELLCSIRIEKIAYKKPPGKGLHAYRLRLLQRNGPNGRWAVSPVKVYFSFQSAKKPIQQERSAGGML
jgi:hypothetical protein